MVIKGKNIILEQSINVDKLWSTYYLDAFPSYIIVKPNIYHHQDNFMGKGLAKRPVLYLISCCCSKVPFLQQPDKHNRRQTQSLALLYPIPLSLILSLISIDAAGGALEALSTSGSRPFWWRRYFVGAFPWQADEVLSQREGKQTCSTSMLPRAWFICERDGAIARVWIWWSRVSLPFCLSSL